ncbi:uncharacterized protein [Triticum aestivum]|uniref:uncharacterized protein isoform X1 n=1 Tax=Triticum aestivum TaxID=4565 RepID=UPI001D01D733|nr:uncharacterized protein LOC123093128 isoform X1 [Triticum aestivum]
MVVEMRKPHALFRWASSAQWLPLVEFGTVSCCCLRRTLGPSLLLIEFSLLLLSLALLLVYPAAYPTCFCLLPQVVRSLMSLRRSTHQESDNTRLCPLLLQNKVEEMTWNLLDMYSCTSYGEAFLGKV